MYDIRILEDSISKPPFLISEKFLLDMKHLQISKDQEEIATEILNLKILDCMIYRFLHILPIKIDNEQCLQKYNIKIL